MNNQTNDTRHIVLSYESASETVAELAEKEVNDLEGVTLYSGIHPKHGAVHIVMPAIGNGMILLPFALQKI